jgi:hypothetical protein
MYCLQVKSNLTCYLLLKEKGAGVIVQNKDKVHTKQFH